MSTSPTIARESIDLEPCPFCGHVGLDFAQGSSFRWLAYSCGGCGMGSETRVKTAGMGSHEEWTMQSKKAAALAWNCRAALTPSQPEPDEQSVYEQWLVDKRPSGNIESVQRQWEASRELRDFLEAQPEPLNPDYFSAGQFSPDELAALKKPEPPAAGVEAVPHWKVPGEKFCLWCQKLGHTTTEHHGTVGVNTPEARELALLSRAAAAGAKP